MPRLPRARRDVQQRTRLCRLVGAGATSALERWQAKAGIDHQDGRENVAASHHHRLQCGRSVRETARYAGRLVARADDGPKATHAGRRRPGQQDSAHRLGAADEARGLQSSGRRRGIGQGRPEVVGDVVGRRKVWRNSRRDRIGKPGQLRVLRARRTDLEPVHELPYGPAASDAASEAGQMAEAVAALMRLDGVQNCIVTVPGSLEDYEEHFGSGGTDWFTLDPTPMATSEGGEFFNPSRILDNVTTFLTSAVAMGYQASYQATFRPSRPHAELIRRARKSASALERERGVPRRLVSAQASSVQRLEEARTLAEEAVTIAPAGGAWMQAWLNDRADMGAYATRRNVPSVRLSVRRSACLSGNLARRSGY